MDWHEIISAFIWITPFVIVWLVFLSLFNRRFKKIEERFDSVDYDMGLILEYLSEIEEDISIIRDSIPNISTRLSVAETRLEERRPRAAFTENTQSVQVAKRPYNRTAKRLENK